MPDDDLPTLSLGVLRVLENSSQRIAEHSACFVKGNTMLLKVRRRFRPVPFKLHAPPCPLRGLSKARKYMTNQVSDGYGACFGCSDHNKRVGSARAVFFLNEK